jgi:hypothetical protein
MIVSVFVRRLKSGHTFEDFVQEWEADVGCGVPTRVFNGPSLDDPGTVVSIGFVGTTPNEVRAWLAAGTPSEEVRRDRISTVVESTELQAMYEVRTEHDFTAEPEAIEIRVARQSAGDAHITRVSSLDRTRDPGSAASSSGTAASSHPQWR